MQAVRLQVTHQFKGPLFSNCNSLSLVERQPKRNASSTRCCTNGISRKMLKFHVRYAIGCLAEIHCVAICAYTQMTEYSNAPNVHRRLRANRI